MTTTSTNIPATMKVAVYHNNRDVRIEERPTPQAGPGELLIRVKASGICGTDVMEWYRIKKGPRVLGHEIAGDIAAIGEGVENFNLGDRVFVSHHVPCDTCKYCLAGNHTACETLHTGNFDPGGFSEYIRVPGINVKSGTYKLPPNVSYIEGTMIEPLACVLRGQRVIGVKPGSNVLILGSGVSGLMNIMVAKLKGAAVTATDLDPYRLDKALEFGADSARRADEPFDCLADKVIICAGAMPAFKQAFQHLDKKGTVLLFAIPDKDISLPTADFWRNEWTVTSSYGAAPEDLAEALSLISAKTLDVESLVSHRLPFADIQKGFDIVTSPNQSLKVALLPFGD